MSVEQYCAEVPGYLRLGPTKGSGAGKSLSIAGGTNPILGKPSALVLVRVKEERSQTDPAKSRYMPVDPCGQDAKHNMESAAWLVPFDRYEGDGFKATIQDSDLKGKFDGVLIVLVYPQTDMGQPTTPLSGYAMVLSMPLQQIPKPSYDDLRQEAKEKITELFKQPVARIERGFLKPLP